MGKKLFSEHSNGHSAKKAKIQPEHEQHNKNAQSNSKKNHEAAHKNANSETKNRGKLRDYFGHSHFGFLPLGKKCRYQNSK